DGEGNIYVGYSSTDPIDFYTGTVAKIDSAGNIEVIAGKGSHDFSGDGGDITQAGIDPAAIAVDPNGNLFIGDFKNLRIRRVDAKTRLVSTFAGDGLSPFRIGDAVGSFFLPTGIAVDRAGNQFILDWLGNRILRVDATSGAITTIAGNGGLNGDFTDRLSEGGFSGDGGPASQASLDLSGTIEVPPERFLTTVSKGILLDSAGNIYFADTGNGRIRKIDADTGMITTVAGGGMGGDGSPATEAAIYAPFALTFDKQGDLFFIEGFTGNIRKIDAVTGIVNGILSATTDLGACDPTDPDPDYCEFPLGLAIDKDNNLLIATEFFIYRSDTNGSYLKRLAGNGLLSDSGDGGPAYQASIQPLGIAVDSADNIYIAENFAIRRIEAK